MHNGRLEDDEHQQREDGVVPVLVEGPEEYAEELEDEERRERVLGEQTAECWPGDWTRVSSVESASGAERGGVVVSARREVVLVRL